MEGTKIQGQTLKRAGMGQAFHIPKPYIKDGLVKFGVKYTIWIIEEKGDDKT